MKRIIAITLSAVIMLSVFAACGKKDENIKDDVKDEMTSIKNDVSDAVEDGKNDMEDIGDKLTENGNVTGHTGEGVLQEAITDISEMLDGDGNKETTKEKSR